jgi:broad specificity phosphatase PhoE
MNQNWQHISTNHKYIMYKNSNINQYGGYKTKKIYLMRHGETPWNKLGKGQGQEADIPMNDAGKEQVRRTALYLKEYRLKDGPFDCIYASPMIRTQESTEIVKDILNFNGEIEYDDLLKERKNGKFSGLTKSDELQQEWLKWRKDIEPIDPIEKYNSFDYVVKLTNEKFDTDFESNTELQNRAQSIINKIINTKCKKILIISHGGLLAEMIKKLFKISVIPEGNFDNGSNCWLSYITYDKNNGFILLSPPNTEHFSLIK